MIASGDCNGLKVFKIWPYFTVPICFHRYLHMGQHNQQLCSAFCPFHTVFLGHTPYYILFIHLLLTIFKKKRWLHVILFYKIPHLETDVFSYNPRCVKKYAVTILPVSHPLLSVTLLYGIKLNFFRVLANVPEMLSKVHGEDGSKQFSLVSVYLFIKHY